MSPNNLFRTSTFKLALVYMVLFAGSVMILLGFIYWSTVTYMSDQTDATIEAEITGLAEQYRQRGLAGLEKTISERAERNPDGSSVYLIATPNRVPLAGNLSPWPDATPTEDGWLEFRLQDENSDGSIFQARARAFVLQDGLQLLVGRDTRELKATQQLITNALLWGIAITIALALAGGVVMSRGMMRRIETINQASRNIMAGDLTQRIPIRGSGDELDQLATNLNRMIDEIERLMDGIRHVSDNIAHDLRTPLTRLRNRLEQLQLDMEDASPHREPLEQGLAEADQLLATFAALLRIARIEAGGHSAKFESTDLLELARDAAELYEVLAEEKQLRFNMQADETVIIQGDRDLLFQALINLLDNAVKYTPAGGEVSLMLSGAGDTANIVISDTGSGIPEQERDKVGQRFYRVESSRNTPGSGLGLSLVEAVARLHQGELLLEDNAPGLKAILRLPVASN